MVHTNNLAVVTSTVPYQHTNMEDQHGAVLCKQMAMQYCIKLQKFGLNSTIAPGDSGGGGLARRSYTHNTWGSIHSRRYGRITF